MGTHTHTETNFQSNHITKSYHPVIPYHIISYHIILCHVIPCHIMSNKLYHTIPYHIIPYHHRIMSCNVMSCHVMSCHVKSYHTIPFPTISYHIISQHLITDMYGVAGAGRRVGYCCLQSCGRFEAPATNPQTPNPKSPQYSKIVFGVFRYKGLGSLDKVTPSFYCVISTWGVPPHILHYTQTLNPKP